MSFTYSHSSKDCNKYRHEFFTLDYQRDNWEFYNYMRLGRERHTCGIIKRVRDEHKILFVSGGLIVYHRSNDCTEPYDDWTNGHAMSYDLTTYPSDWNETMRGTIREQNLEFTKISPYEGFIFKWGGGATDWWIWDVNKEDFVKTTSEYPRDSVRHEFSVATIPKSSPFIKNCT